MINMFKPKVTQITINVYEKQEFNIIEILTSKNIELKIDNSIKQLAQHLDAQYKKHKMIIFAFLKAFNQ